MITAKNSIDIARPAPEIWAYLTNPRAKQYWIAGDPGSYIASGWSEGSQVTWKTADNQDYMRGQVVRMVENKELVFSLHDAFEEDQARKSLTGEMAEHVYSDINIEQWRFTLNDIGGLTRLTLEVSDYDAGHSTEADHDHNGVVAAAEEMSELIIPGMLEKIAQNLN